MRKSCWCFFSCFTLVAKYVFSPCCVKAGRGDLFVSCHESFVFRHVDCWLFFFISLFFFRAAHTWRVSFVDSVTRCVAVRTFITMYMALPQWWDALHPLPGKTAVRVTIVQKIAAPDRTGTDSHLVRDKVCVYCVCACIYYTYIYINIYKMIRALEENKMLCQVAQNELWDTHTLWGLYLYMDV